MSINLTGQKCRKKGTYSCSIHPYFKVRVKKNKVFPKCRKDIDNPHPTNWDFQSEGAVSDNASERKTWWEKWWWRKIWYPLLGFIVGFVVGKFGDEAWDSFRPPKPAAIEVASFKTGHDNMKQTLGLVNRLITELSFEEDLDSMTYGKSLTYVFRLFSIMSSERENQYLRNNIALDAVWKKKFVGVEGVVNLISFGDITSDGHGNIQLKTNDNTKEMYEGLRRQMAIVELKQLQKFYDSAWAAFSGDTNYD